MARFHREIRESVEASIPDGQPVRAVVSLMSVTGTSRGPDGGGPELSHNAEDNYVRKAGLDPALRIDGIQGYFGLVCALTDTDIHFFYSAGQMRKGGPVVLLSSHRRQEVQLRHQRSGVPFLRTRLMHFTFADGQYFVGSSAHPFGMTTAINEPRRFVEAFGPAAIDNKAR